MNSRRCFLGMCAALLAAGAGAGCGGGRVGVDRPLDPDLARASVQKALQAWVDGKKPEDLQPEIIIGDAAWTGGSTLVSFELVKERESSDGANLHVPVVRELRTPNGKVSKSETLYIVSTSPAITIFPQ